MTFTGKDGQSVVISVAKEPTAGHVWVGQLGGSEVWWYESAGGDTAGVLPTACDNADMVIKAHKKFLATQADLDELD